MITIDQTRAAATGTDACLLTPNISMLAATPANSAVVVHPNRSRMRSARPLQVLRNYLVQSIVEGHYPQDPALIVHHGNA